jgi:probable 2-oxoglutarate dehydrogenase E1 component DHKTD1
VLTTDVEAVNAVAAGKARAKQYALLKRMSSSSTTPDCMLGDRVMCVQLHGDASFTGQGVVMETLGLSEASFERHQAPTDDNPQAT